MDRFYPIFPSPILIEADTARIRLDDTELRLSAPADLLRALFGLCDGDRSAGEIVSRLASRWNRAQVRALLAELRGCGVLVDRAHVYEHLWRRVELRDSAAPGGAEAIVARVEANVAEGRVPAVRRGYGVPEAYTARLLRQRRSIRTFSSRSLSRDDLFAILWAAYGVVERIRLPGVPNVVRCTVPSAGALYPLRVYLVLSRPLPSIAAGTYRVEYGLDGRVRLRRQRADDRGLFRAFVDPSLLVRAQGTVVLAGSFSQAERTFGSRALLYVPLEVGHAAQNVLVAAAERGLAACEVGGFFERRLGGVVGTPADVIPMSTIAFGAPPTRTESRRALRDLPIEFKWAPVETTRCFVGMARSRDAKPAAWSFGVAADAREAFCKSVMEARERHACVRPHGLVESSFAGLRSALLPTELIVYSDEQHATRNFPFRRFDPKTRLLWKRGRDAFSGKPVYVPAECVYFADGLPSRYRRRALTVATSSGTAAFTTFEGAAERALLELIERDAFMLTWLARRPPARVAPSSLPSRLRRWVSDLEQTGLRVTLLELSREFAPVLAVFAQHRGEHFTCVTAAAGFVLEEAVEHALSESEGAIASRLYRRERRAISPHAVVTPEDHADFYAQRRCFRAADFLTTGMPVDYRRIGAGRPRNIGQLYSRLKRFGHRPIEIDMTPTGALHSPGTAPPYVVRMIIPGLVPMSFGYGLEPLGLPRVPQHLHKGRVSRVPHPFV